MARVSKELRFSFAKVDPDEFKKRLESSFADLALDGKESPWWNLAKELDIDPACVDALIAVVREGKWKNSAAPCLYIWQAVQRRTENEYRDPFDPITGKRGADHNGRTICFSDCAPEDWMIPEDIRPRGGRRGKDGLFHQVKGWRAELAEGKRWAKRRENGVSHDTLVSLPDIREAKHTLVPGRSLSDLEMAAMYFRAFGYPRKEFLDIGGRALTGRGCSEEELLATWRRVHRNVGDDAAEVLLMVARACGMTREEFLAAARTKEERLKRQAAWRRVRQNGVLPTLRDKLREHIRTHPHDDDWNDPTIDPLTYGGWRNAPTGPREPDDPWLGFTKATREAREDERSEAEYSKDYHTVCGW